MANVDHIRTVGFKGFDIDEDVPQKVIYIGKNKKGKSTRAGAIAVALYGHIPFSTAGKRPGDILDSFGDDSIVSSVTIGGTEFARKISRSDKDKVTQSVQINRKKASAQNYAIMLDKAGCPKIADVAEFMKQSEAKKIDTLFDLFPNPELASIDIEIEEAKEDVSRWQKKKDGAESTVQRLTNSKNGIELPPGNIAECQSEINKVETQIVVLEEQIKQAEIEEAAERAKAEGAQEEREKIEKEASEPPVEVEPMKTDSEWEQHDLDGPSNNPRLNETDELITKMENDFERFEGGTDQSSENKDDGCFVSDMAHQIIGGSPAESIQRIIEAITEVGCGTCAALIVAKQELKKYTEA